MTGESSSVTGRRGKTGLGVGLAFIIGVLTFFITMQVVRMWTGQAAEPLTPAEKREEGGLQVPYLKRTDGEEERIWRLKEHAGKIVVVNLFTTWCPGCIEELPELKSIAREYAARGVVFAALSLDQDGERKGLPRETVLRQFQKDAELPFPILLPARNATAWQMGSVPIPQTFLYDRQGRLARLITGSVVGKNVRESLDDLLKEPVAP